VLSAEAYSKEGLNPTFVLFDELHAQPNRALWDVMNLAQASRGRMATTVAITTAGSMRDQTGGDSIAYTLYQYGKGVALGEIDDPTFFMAWWEAEGDYRDPEVWQKANPGYGDLSDPADFESSVRRTTESEFKTKRLNVWTSIIVGLGALIYLVWSARTRPGREVLEQPGAADTDDSPREPSPADNPTPR
jgi:phage terminase large subunit-like protein